jgi:pyrroloquinoline quinone biosynthesis protein B
MASAGRSPSEFLERHRSFGDATSPGMLQTMNQGNNQGNNGRGTQSRIRDVLILVVRLCVGMALTAFAARSEAFDRDVEPLRSSETVSSSGRTDAPFLLILGIAQDAGYPQAGCQKACCERAWVDPAARRHTVCVAIVDPVSRQRWLLDCSPDFREQLRACDRAVPISQTSKLDGVFLTHAHIGHYTGLIHLGREVMGANEVVVHAMPRMRHFLENNGPWDQLVSLDNIRIHDLKDGQPVKLNERISVTPFLVPHRDEYSETVGFRIAGQRRSAIYLPDIDKWDRWTTPIEKILAENDVAWLDGTFYNDTELPGRDMSQIPHPFIVESLSRFRDLPKADRSKVRFLHLNHTNPLLNPTSAESRIVEESGHHVAVEGERFVLD